MDTGYPMVTKALNNTGRPIVFSCSWPAYQVAAKITVRGILFLLLLARICASVPHNNLYTKVFNIGKRTPCAALQAPRESQTNIISKAKCLPCF